MAPQAPCFYPRYLAAPLQRKRLTRFSNHMAPSRSFGTIPRQIKRCSASRKAFGPCLHTSKTVVMLRRYVALLSRSNYTLTAWKAFRENHTYRLEQPAMPADIKTRLNRQSMSPTNRFSPGRAVFQPQMAALRKVTEDCTIFVGSLPPTVTQEQLMRFFGGFGHIRSVEIIAKPSANSTSSPEHFSLLRC